MFNRRQKPSLNTKLLRLVWPTMGWRRTITYMINRIRRLPGTPYSIASGFACGVAMSFTPFVGLHFILSGILAWMIRANILASALGTAVGNPWTFPFIWVWLYEVGHWMGFGVDVDKVHEFDFSYVFVSMLKALLDGDLDQLLVAGAPVFWPMLVASIPTSTIVWLAFYLLLKSVLTRHQKERSRRPRLRGKRR